jgi:hypothetical protein
MTQHLIGMGYFSCPLTPRMLCQMSLLACGSKTLLTSREQGRTAFELRKSIRRGGVPLVTLPSTSRRTSTDMAQLEWPGITRPHSRYPKGLRGSMPGQRSTASASSSKSVGLPLVFGVKPGDFGKR